MSSIPIQQEFLYDQPSHKLILEETKMILRDEKIQHRILHQNQAQQTLSFHQPLSHKTLDTIWVAFIIESLNHVQRDKQTPDRLLPTPQHPDPNQFAPHDFNITLQFLSHFNPNINILDIYRNGDINNIYIPSYREYLSLQHRGRTQLFTCLISHQVYARVQSYFPTLLSTELFTSLSQGPENAVELHTIMNAVTQLHYSNDFYHLILRFCDHRQRLSVLEIPKIIASIVYEFTTIRSNDSEGLVWLSAQDPEVLRAYYLACSIRLYPQLTQYISNVETSCQFLSGTGVGNDITSLGFDDILLEKLVKTAQSSVKTRQNIYFSLARGKFDKSIKELVGSQNTLEDSTTMQSDLAAKLKYTISKLSEQSGPDTKQQGGNKSTKKHNPLSNTTSKFQFFKKASNDNKLLPSVHTQPGNQDNIPFFDGFSQNSHHTSLFSFLFQNLLLFENIESKFDQNPLTLLYRSHTDHKQNPNNHPSPLPPQRLSQSIRSNQHLIQFHANLQFALENNTFLSIFQTISQIQLLRTNINIIRTYTLFLLKTYFLHKDLSQFQTMIQNPGKDTAEKAKRAGYQLFIEALPDLSPTQQSNTTPRTHKTYSLLPISTPFYELNTAEAVGYSFASELKKKHLINTGPQSEQDEAWYRDNIDKSDEDKYQALFDFEHALDFSPILDPLVKKAHNNIYRQQTSSLQDNVDSFYFTNSKPTPTIHINDLLAKLPWQQLASQYNDATFLSNIFTMLPMNYTITPFTYQYIEYLYSQFNADPLTKLTNGISLDSLKVWLKRTIPIHILALVFERYGKVVRISVETYHKYHKQPPQNVFSPYLDGFKGKAELDSTHSHSDPQFGLPTAPTQSTNQEIYHLYLKSLQSLQSPQTTESIPHNLPQPSDPINSILAQHLSVSIKMNQSVNTSGLFYTIPTLSWCNFLRFIFAIDYPYEKESISFWFNALDTDQTGILTSESIMTLCQASIHHIYQPCAEMATFYQSHPFFRTIQSSPRQTTLSNQELNSQAIQPPTISNPPSTLPISQFIDRCEKSCEAQTATEFPTTHEFNSIVLSQYSSFLDPNHPTRFNTLSNDDLKINNKGRDSVRVQRLKSLEKLQRNHSSTHNQQLTTTVPAHNRSQQSTGATTPITKPLQSPPGSPFTSTKSQQSNQNSTHLQPPHFQLHSTATASHPNCTLHPPRLSQSYDDNGLKSFTQPLRVTNTINSNTNTAYHCSQCYTYSTLIMTLHTVALAQLSTIPSHHTDVSHHNHHDSGSQPHSAQFYIPPLSSLFNTNQYDITRYSDILHFLDSPSRYGLTPPPASNNSTGPSHMPRFQFNLQHFLTNQDAVKILYVLCFPNSDEILDDFDESESLPRDTFGFPIVTTLRGEILNYANLEHTDIPFSFNFPQQSDNTFGTTSHDNTGMLLNRLDGLGDENSSHSHVLSQITQELQTMNNSARGVDSSSHKILQRYNNTVQHMFLQQYILGSKQLLDVEGTRLVEHEHITRCCTEIQPL